MDVLAIDSRGLAAMVAIPSDVLVSIALRQALIWCRKDFWLVNQRWQFGHGLIKLDAIIQWKTVSTDQLFNVFDPICCVLDQIKYYIEEQGKVVEGSPICGGS